MIYLQNSDSTHGGFEIYDGNNNRVNSKKRFWCNRYQQYVKSQNYWI